MLLLSHDKIENYSYEDIENYLFAIPKFSKKNTMDDTRCFYEWLGSPGSNKKIIHVAGTNGKGSVCAYLSSILCAEGFSVSMFSSPHLVEMRERFLMNQFPVSKEIFSEAFFTVIENLYIMRGKYKKDDYHPSFFEFLFFMGMVIFEKQNTDYIILETGLGGRLDATNVIEHPLLTVITEIGMDHTEYLGNTVEEIAAEKAGILKTGVPVVFCDKRKAATNIILERSKKLGIQAFPVGKEDYKDIKLKNKNIDFSYHSRYYDYIRLTLSTRALYQIENASLAARCIEVLDSERTILHNRIEEGIRNMKWEGRMEEVLPEIFVDGAHNEDGINAFMESVKADGCIGKRYLLFSVAADKDYETMMRILEKGHLFEITAAARLNNTRGAAIDALKEASGKYTKEKRIFCESVDEALDILMNRKKNGDYIYIAGSLYLVGEVKTLLRRKTDD